MAVIILCAKFLGLLREVMIASVYGQGYASDVLNTSTQIPLLFFDMTLGVAILSTFVPTFNKLLEKDGKSRAVDFANTFLTTVVVLSAVFAALGMVFARPLVQLMVPGYDLQKVLETVRLLRILFPSIIFTAAAYTSVGILQSFGEFNIPSLISVVSNLIMIVYLAVFGDRLGLSGVVISMVVAWASQLVIQLPYLRRFGFWFRPRLNFRDEGLREAARLAVPVLVSSWVQPLCVVINMAFGSALGDGAVSGLNWANKLYVIMVGVFAYAVTNFIFPRLSRMNASDNSDAFRETTRTSVGWTVFIIGFISAMFIALGQPVVKLVFQRGEFTAGDTLLTATALKAYSVGMIGYAICEILNKSFYAIQDGKTPMLSSIVGVAVNFGLAFVLISLFRMGVGGLALASGLSSVVMAVLLVLMMNRRKKSTFDKGFLINLIKIITASALSGLAAYGVYRLLGNPSGGAVRTFIDLCVSGISGLLCYAVLAVALKTYEVRQIFDRKER